jgi:hypothetical protein
MFVSVCVVILLNVFVIFKFYQTRVNEVINAVSTGPFTRYIINFKMS